MEGVAIMGMPLSSVAVAQQPNQVSTFNYNRASEDLMKKLYAKADNLGIPVREIDEIVYESISVALTAHVPDHKRMSRNSFNKIVVSAAYAFLKQYAKNRKEDEEENSDIALEPKLGAFKDAGEALQHSALALEFVYNSLGLDTTYFDIIDGDEEPTHGFNNITIDLKPPISRTNLSAISNPYEFFRSNIMEAIDQIPELDLGILWQRYVATSRHNLGLDITQKLCGEDEIAGYIAEKTYSMTTNDVLEQPLFYRALRHVLYDKMTSTTNEEIKTDSPRTQNTKYKTRPLSQDISLITFSKSPDVLNYTKLRRYIRRCGIPAKWASRIAQYVKDKRFSAKRSMDLVQKVSSDPALLFCFRNVYNVQFQLRKRQR